jgi:hypothetical protein
MYALVVRHHATMNVQSLSDWCTAAHVRLDICADWQSIFTLDNPCKYKQHVAQWLRHQFQPIWLSQSFGALG